MASPMSVYRSPASHSMSITPRAATIRRRSMSATPTPAMRTIHDSADDMDKPDEDEHNDDYYEEWPEENDWGHDAMLDWDATAGGDDDASSVNTREAGLSDDDAESDWGRDAYLAWDNEVDDANTDDHDDSDDDALPAASSDLRDDATEESEQALVARGMPDYRTWELKNLQKLCKSYGYRPITKHTTLVDLAVQCWRAIHPTPTCGRSKPVPVPSSAPSRSSSISSADMPLATIQQSRKAGKQSQTRVQSKSKARQAVSAQNVETLSPPPAHVLSSRFFRMIKDDEALYLRILRYEPISFDELVSKAIASGIEDRGWRPKLKKFLDEQGVTYFTEDPTGNRRRH